LAAGSRNRQRKRRRLVLPPSITNSR
jgi:hypothetical protein